MKNRLGSILLSIAIAFGLWLYVITYVSPNSEETYYNIPVVLEGESVLNERGLMCTSTSSSTVSLQLAGARSDLIKVNQNNITVKANLSAITEPGQKIAFVGSTGAGKTTITNLINRFYDVQEGTITYDGINVKDIQKASLRRSLGMVLQDTHLFTGTIADNIRYGKLDATDEEIRAAARLANADGFIRHLPQGYDTVITGDGAGLSQGERQLLAQLRQAIGEDGAILQTDVSARRQGAYLMVTLRAECEEQIGVDAPLAITSDTGR